jgi:hypothetical protein
MHRSVPPLLILLALVLPLPAQAEENCALLRPFAGMFGDWYVLDADGVMLGISEIRSVAGGCALREQWHGADGLEGEALITPADDGAGLRMTWVDSDGLVLELAGAADQGSIRFNGLQNTPDGLIHHRIEWHDEPVVAFSQRWEYSTDDGLSWQTFFVGWYVRPGEMGPG